MATFLIILSLMFVFWIMYGRGALIVHRHKRDEGVLLPQDLTNKEEIIEFLKKELTYKELKDIYFDENGNICIAGKYDTYYVHFNGERLYIDEQIPTMFDTTSQPTSWAYIARLFNRKNAKRIEELECIRAYIIKTFDHSAPINAYQKYTKMTKAHKYSGWISGVFTVLIVILIISALSSGNENVKSIRNGHFESYSTTITVGEAFEDFFVDTEWTSYDKGDEEYVKFSGECTWNNKKAEMNVVFKIEGDRFFIDEIVLYTDNERITTLNESYVLQKIYSSYNK